MICYDCEVLPNLFTLSAMEHRRPETMFTWEISERRNDLPLLMQWFAHLNANQIEMIGFNNLGFDYPIIDLIFRTPFVTVELIYALCQRIINSQTENRFEFQIWERERFAPQIDLFKIHHFDNKAKSTGLKALEFAMRSRSVQNMPVEPGTFVRSDQIDTVIGYNQHDVLETDKFAEISGPNIEFRRELRSWVKGDVLNFNDTKIGKQILEQRLGEQLCYTRDQWGRKKLNQTHRSEINLGQIIFPYIRFQHTEFNNILTWLKGQTIHHTKGVFSDVEATINGFTFQFGTGGIHGSITSRRVTADADHSIEDIDVAALYPRIAIENGLYPEHLGQTFVTEYRALTDERKKYAKGTSMNAAFKLGANGSYGDSNNQYSPLYDPQFTMSITVNGQLLLCMLADRLIDIPTIEIIQINTDGITYRIHRDWLDFSKQICTQWERETRLVLERATYQQIFIRDVNNYLAVGMDGKRKLKGAYWYPKKMPEDISNASPSAWYKDMSAMIVQRAAEAALVDGIDPRIYIPFFRDPFDFMIRAKARGGDQLFIGDQPAQPMTRYYVAKRGAPLRIIRPVAPGNEPGAFKRKNKLSEYDWQTVLASIPPGTWDARIHTANKSIYEERESNLQAGYLVAECNQADRFDWSNVNYDWYIEETRKLVIA